MKRSFCILPFTQTVIRTDGMISTCCIVPGWVDIRRHSIRDFWQDARLKDMQQAMLRDETLEACDQCYRAERQSGKSMRLDNLDRHKVDMRLTTDQILDQCGFRDLPSPKFIEMHVNNVCNLKCLTCRPEDSSMFLAENSQLGISQHRQTDYTIPEDLMVERLRELQEHDLDYLDLRGGESMLVPQVKTFLRELPSDHNIRMIRLQTNGTILLTPEWQEIFKKFPKIGMMLSVDGYAADNHYIRYPADWQIIERNFDILREIPNVYFCVSCTLSNLNLPVVHKLVAWCKHNHIPFYWSELVLPPYFHYTNLPEEIYQESIKSLEPFDDFVSLQPKKFDPSLWQQFCNMIDQRDRHRHNSIFDIIPELKPHWIYQ